MRRAYVNNWIVLNTAGWAAREQPLESNEGGFNSENGDVRIGPGMWADLAPDEAPGIGAVTPVGFPYRFSVINTAPGISAGYVRVNGTSDALFIRKTDMVVQDRSTTLATLSAGGLVYLNSVVDDGAVAVFKATSCEDSGTYYTVNGILSGSLPNDNDEIRVTVAPSDVGAEYVLDPSIVNVSGSGEPAADGVYLQAGWFAGRRWYAKVGGVNTGRAHTSDSVYFGGPGLGWRINRDGWGIAYVTTDDTANPWSGTWVSNNDPDPAPTVAQGYNTLEGSLASRYPSPMWMDIEGRITQTGTSDPVITMLRDDFDTGDPEYVAVGQYRISDIGNIGNADLCSTWFSDSGGGAGTLSMYMASGKLQIRTRDLTGTLTNGLVTDTYFKLTVRVNDPE
jgi:hypothetical protein